MRPMTFCPPESFNMADFFLDARVREDGSRTALIVGDRSYSYAEVQERAHRFANLLRDAGIQPEQRVLIALPDGVEFVAAFFGVLKLGAVVVMLNPELSSDLIGYFLDYTRARAAFVSSESRAAFEGAAQSSHLLDRLFIVGTEEFDSVLEQKSTHFGNFPSHRDDAAIWLFSGGTTGKPKAVVQTHRAFANTTVCYAQGALGMTASDVTLSVPKLFFGYATGCNLLFPFSVGGSAVLFPERCTADVIFEKIRRHRPTILINVPTMVKKLLEDPHASEQNLSCLRFSTSAGEALPVDLHLRWNETFGVDLLDGLGTAEMWHIFISNLPGDVHPGTLGRVVPGFEVRVCDDVGRELPRGETGWLWVRGGSRAIAYWQHQEKTESGFRGEWYVSGDMIRQEESGLFIYCGRADDMLKVSGKWLATREVEECLELHPSVREAAVVGVLDDHGLTKPHAFVVANDPSPQLAQALQDFVRSRLEPYKYPRRIEFMADLPRTHLGKVDRGKLRREDARGALDPA
jgi:benzoate-CoA ligase family protein